MKKYEIESLLKSFFIFYLLQTILLSIIFLQLYNHNLILLKKKILSDMKLCSLDLNCKEFQLDFTPKDRNLRVNFLYENKNTLYSFFPIPKNRDFFLKIILDRDSYDQMVKDIKKNLIEKFVIYDLFIALISFLFSLYALYPIKRALNLNVEFIRDILHDINTPLASMVINLKMLKKDCKNNKKITRLENSISSIIYLQENLRAFLKSSLLQKEKISLKELLIDRINYFKGIFPKVIYNLNLKDVKIYTNKEAFIRIVDNLLSNASKYSPTNPKVDIYLDGTKLYIKDNGVGIKNVSMVFKRYYKENERGMGLGLNIVYKLSKELDIPINIESEIGVGTVVILDLEKVMEK